MAMTITRKKETSYKKVIMHRIADIRGGVGIKASELVHGGVLPEGTPVGAPVNGIASVLKVAKLHEDATSSAVEYKVEKGSNFKEGEFITAGVGKKAYAITAIDKSNAAYDVISVGTTLGVAISAGNYVVAAKAEVSTNASVLAVQPVGITGTTAINIDTKTNLPMDVWVMAVTKGALLPADVLAAMKGIINL